MNKPDLALNNLQRLICHKTKLNQTKLISVRRQDLMIVNNKKRENLPNSGFCRPSRRLFKIKRK